MLNQRKSPALTRAIEIPQFNWPHQPLQRGDDNSGAGDPEKHGVSAAGRAEKQRFISMDNQDNYCLTLKLVELAGQALEQNGTTSKERAVAPHPADG